MDKVVLITGALTGIGKATAISFAKDKYKLVVSGRRDNVGQALEAELRELGAEVHYKKADVSVDSEVKALIDYTVSTFGRIDIAINNAGTEGKGGPLIDLTVADYANTFATNVQGVFSSMKYELSAMVKQKSGVIINISSIAGKAGLPNSSIYIASKHAVEGFTKAAAVEYAGMGIRVNAVAPGPIDTEMLDRFVPDKEAMDQFIQSFPAKRKGRVEEIAATIRFLASDQAGYIIGESISVDGGFLAG